MPKRTPEITVIRAVPLGADADLENEIAYVTFVLENGDHLHVEMAIHGLEKLSRHIEHAREQLHDGTVRRTEN